MGFFLQFAMCPFEKLRVVIVLDHSIRKDVLAGITTMDAIQMYSPRNEPDPKMVPISRLVDFHDCSIIRATEAILAHVAN